MKSERDEGYEQGHADAHDSMEQFIREAVGIQPTEEKSSLVQLVERLAAANRVIDYMQKQLKEQNEELRRLRGYQVIPKEEA